MNDNEIFTAEMARAMSKSFDDQNLNAKRQQLLDLIKSCAMGGEFSAHTYGGTWVEHKYFEFDDSDYMWLEKLGYKVTKPHVKIFATLAGLRRHEEEEKVAGKIEW